MNLCTTEFSDYRKLVRVLIHTKKHIIGLLYSPTDAVLIKKLNIWWYSTLCWAIHM